MNEYEVEERVRQYKDHPILGPATRTLDNLMRWTNRNSDGWPYWQKPSRASAQLQKLIAGDRLSRFDNEREDVTEAAYKKALVPVKAFRTRQKADFYIEEVGKGPEPVEEPEDLDFDHIAETQGWNVDSRADLMREFIGRNGLNEALGMYAAEVARTENKA